MLGYLTVHDCGNRLRPYANTRTTSGTRDIHRLCCIPINTPRAVQRAANEKRCKGVGHSGSLLNRGGQAPTAQEFTIVTPQPKPRSSKATRSRHIGRNSWNAQSTGYELTHHKHAQKKEENSRSASDKACHRSARVGGMATSITLASPSGGALMSLAE